MEKVWGIRLIRLAAIFALVGVVIGSKMSGDLDYSLRPIHAHVLLVGWLSVFAWGIFYRNYRIKKKVLVTIHGWLAVIGSIGMTSSMWNYNFNPFNTNETFNMILFIICASILLLAFTAFIVNTFMIEED